MGLEYYAFALFIAGLISLIAILLKMLFSNVKKQYKLLDEKETKLLQLYQTVEGIMEEWGDQVKTTMEEIKEHEMRSAARAAAFAMAPAPTPPPPPPESARAGATERPSRSERVDSTRLRAASEVLARAERIIKNDTLKNPAVTVSSANGAVFQRLFDETVADKSGEQTEATAQQIRNEAILSLAAEGKTDGQIASELGITRNEVKLVIGLTSAGHAKK